MPLSLAYFCSLWLYPNGFHIFCWPALTHFLSCFICLSLYVSFQPSPLGVVWIWVEYLRAWRPQNKWPRKHNWLIWVRTVITQCLMCSLKNKFCQRNLMISAGLLFNWILYTITNLMNQQWWLSGLSHHVSNSSRDSGLGPRFQSHLRQFYKLMVLTKKAIINASWIPTDYANIEKWFTWSFSQTLSINSYLAA